MNTAFHDAINLAWKIHLVQAGFAKRSILQSYESERKRIAEDLLNFDAKYAALFSQRKPSADEVGAVNEENKGEETDEFVQMFKANQDFTSGYGVVYGPNEINWSPDHCAKSDLFNPKGNKLSPGRVMPFANVTRVVDANEVHLEQDVPFNGSFRLFIFAGIPTTTKRAIEDFAQNLQKKRSFYTSFERQDVAEVSHHERHNPHSWFITVCTIFAAPHATIEISHILPPVLARYSDHVYADDISDANMLDAKAAAHLKMGFEAEKGGVLVVRPDGHVGCVISLVKGSGTVDALNEYFRAFASKPVGKDQFHAHL